MATYFGSRFTYKDLSGQERELLYPVATDKIKAEISTMTIDGDTLVDVATYPALNCFNYVRETDLFLCIAMLKNSLKSLQNEEPLLHHIKEKLFSPPDGQPLNLR